MKSPVTGTFEFYRDLMSSLILDIHQSTTSQKSALRDVTTACKRLSNEGLFFLTTCLPQLGKALDLALETGVFNPPLGFAVRKGTKIPLFMGDKFNTIFDRDGCVLDQPDPYSIQELRQLFYTFYKLDIPYSSEKDVEAVEKLVSTERELSEARFGDLDEKVVKRAQALLKTVLSGIDWRNIQPKHGPGGVNTGEKGSSKWLFKRIFKNAHQCYPWYDYMLVGRGRELIDRISWWKALVKQDSSWSKVCLVPKDSRGPRVISIEPLETQYLQQGQMRLLVNRVESHPLTKGRVNFLDQSINGKLALQSSTDRRYATMDLSEASDRVHVNLVRILFPEEATRYLMSTRSDGTVLPSGEKLAFRKFAPMGSATCFPILALTIWSLLRAYLDSVGCHDECYVYGDDVVVPSTHFAGCSRLLEGANLRVNREKSFVAGYFRESCGVDAYKGIVVTPLRVRKPWSGKSSDSSAFASYLSLANNLFSRGFWKAASCIQTTCEALYGKIPYGTPTSGFACLEVSDPFLAERLNSRLGRKRARWNRRLQRYEFRVLSLISEKTEDFPISGWRRLLRDLLDPPWSTNPSLVASRQQPKLSWRWMPV